MTPDGRQQVLLVEDEPLLRETIATSLEDEGFGVLQAGTGEEALHLIRTHTDAIDWLLTDIRLPGALDGWHVAFEFRFVHPLRPVIYATGYARPLPPMVAGSLFLRKPYALADVIAALRQLTDAQAACGPVSGAQASAPQANVPQATASQPTTPQAKADPAATPQATGTPASGPHVAGLKDVSGTSVPTTLPSGTAASPPPPDP